MHTTIEQAIKELPADAVESIIKEYIGNFSEELINITDEHAHSDLELTQFKERVLSRFRFIHASTYKQWLLHTIPKNLLVNLKTRIESITQSLRHRTMNPDETEINAKSMEMAYEQPSKEEGSFNYAKYQHQRLIDLAKLLAKKVSSTLTSSSLLDNSLLNSSLLDSSLLNSSLLDSRLLDSSLFSSSTPVVTTRACEKSYNPSNSQSTISNISSNISSQNNSDMFSHDSPEKIRTTYLIDKELLCFIFAVIHYREAMNTKKNISINGILIQPNLSNLEHITINSGASEVYKAWHKDRSWLFTIFQEKLLATFVTNHFNSNTEIPVFEKEEPHILPIDLDRFRSLISQGSLITKDINPYPGETKYKSIHPSYNSHPFLEQDLIETALDGSIVPINSIRDLQDITNSQTVKCY